MSGLSLGKSKNQINEKATSFTQNAPVQTTAIEPSIQDKVNEQTDVKVLEEDKNSRKEKKGKLGEVKVAPWRHGLNINSDDLKLIQRPFNNNISHENYLRLVYLKSLGSIGLGSNKDTFSSMLDEALTEYTARRLKALGDNYDI